MSKFVEKYKKLRLENFNPQESFGLTCLHIESSGTMKDLTEVMNFYTKDMFNEWDELMKEAQKNESNPVA